MKRSVCETPEEYVRALAGWQHQMVSGLRQLVLGAAKFEESIKWGHLVYMFNGPVLLIRSEEERVLFGFWRGKRLRDLEPRLRPGGKYEMATVELHEGDSLSSEVVDHLAREAHALNLRLGDPRSASKQVRKPDFSVGRA